MKRHAFVLAIAALAMAAAPASARGRLARFLDDAPNAEAARPVMPVVQAVVTAIQKVDTDASKTISAPEFTAAGGTPATFAVIDANANGELGFFEVLKAVVRRIVARRNED